MLHSEFIQLWNQGKLEVDVDGSKALQIASSNMLPKRYRSAHILWSWVCILSIPAALVVMYFYKWWVGLSLLFLLFPALSIATKKSAMQLMIDRSVGNSEFYQFAITEGAIRVMPKP